MKMRVWAGLAAGLLFVGGALADDLQSAQKRIVDKWNDVKTLTAKVVVKKKIKNSGKETGSISSTGEYEYARHDGKFMYHLTLDTELVANPKGKEMKFKEKSEAVSDGEATYTISEAMGRKNAVKEAPSRELPELGDRKLMFEAWNKESTLKLLPAEKIGDAECYVIEATPKTPKPRSAVVKTVYYFSQDNGMLLKSAGKDAGGDDVEVTTYNEIKANEKIDPDHFKFKAPEGVKVRDKGNPKP